MELSTELKVLIFFISFIIIWAIIQVLFLKYVYPRIAIFFYKFFDSYKYCVRFIKKNEKIKELLGEVKIIESIPTPNYVKGFMSFPKYRFHLHGASQSGKLNITMHWGRESKQQSWLFDVVDLEIKGKFIDLKNYV